MSPRPPRNLVLRAALFAVVGVCVGGVTGWLTTQPVYGATGVLAVPQHQTLVAALPPCPWRKSPASVLADPLASSRRFTVLATLDEAWLATGEASGREAAASFEARRHLVPDPDMSTVRVHFDDPRPEVALAGVRALLSTYERLDGQLLQPVDEDARRFGEFLADQREPLRTAPHEATDAPRPRVQDWGSLPTRPFRDARPSSAAVGAGAGVGFGLLLASLFRRRDP